MKFGETVTVETTDGHRLTGRVTYSSPDAVRLTASGWTLWVQRSAVARATRAD